MSLDFKNCPPVTPEDQDIRDALKIVGIVPEDDAAREHPPEFPDEVGLERIFPWQDSSLAKFKRT
jgi:hypothetical protein